MTKSQNINRPRWTWTTEHVATLRQLYPLRMASAVAEAIGCSVQQVYRKADQLGLKKAPSFYASEECGHSNLKKGGNTRFAKGLVPWNKGQKLPGHGNPSTFFKPGQRSHTFKPIGSHRLSKDGYLQIKLTETGYPPKDWVSYHRHVWEQANGPIPAKHIVVFKPGKKTTDPELITADCLECISLVENMKRNSFHQYGPEVAAVHQLRGAITRQINKRTKEQTT